MKLQEALLLLLAMTAISPVLPRALSAADNLPETAVARRRVVERLLRELDADERAVRQRAERELLELGPDILAFLPAPELLRSPAVKASVGQIRVTLERRKARESVLPARVTLAGKLPLVEILGEIARQTGNSLNLSALEPAMRNRVLAVKFEKQTFWKALDDVTSRAGLRYAFDAAADSLTLVPRAADAGAGELAFNDNGPFRIAVDGARLRRVAGVADYRQLRLELSVAPEPRLRPLFLMYAGADAVARDRTGELLPPRNPDARYELPLSAGGRHLDFTLDFQVPVATELGKVSVRSKFVVQTAAGAERIQFTDVLRAAGVARRRGGVTVTLEDVAAQKTAPTLQNLTVRANVAYDVGGPAFESHRTWIFHNEVYLETKSGKRFVMNGGYDTSRQGNGTVGVEYRFEGVPAPLDDYSFVYVAPTLIVDVPVEFEFEGVPVTGP